MVFRETIGIKKEDLERVNGLLNIRELGVYTEKERLLNPKMYDFIGLVSVTFENGNCIDIDVCSGIHNYYDNCVLKDRDENEITCFDCKYCIGNEMEFCYENDTYIITVEAL